MKMLVIALDGGDKRIINIMDMPFLKSLLAGSVSLEIEEDLWSRGWVNVLTGVHGKQSGGFYYKPKLDGTHDFHSRFGGKDYQSSHFVPIWEKLNRKGYKVGFLGVNTTMPPPVVDGFFLSGPGGGFKPGIEVPEAACYPKEIQPKLTDSKYIWEVRFTASGVRDTSDFFSLLREEAKSRVEPFINLCQEYSVDLGFFFTKAPVVTENLAMVEIEQLIRNGGKPENLIQQEIVEFYRCLDDTIREVLERLQPKNYMVISDHGAAPYETAVNINAFLQQVGMQDKSSNCITGVPQTGKKIAKRFLSAKSKRALTSMTGLTKPKIRNWDDTLAFGSRYISGIYLNDRERFGGPVDTVVRKAQLVKKIVEDFNASSEAKMHNMQARPYRELYLHEPFHALLPDIWIDKPDTVFFECGFNAPFVQPNPNYKPLKSLHSVTRDLYTGIKGRHPLLYIDKATVEHVQDEDQANLTIAYHIMERALNK